MRTASSLRMDIGTFLINFPLQLGRTSRRDDANVLAVAHRVFPGVRHQQQGHIGDHSDGLPALLTVLRSILSGDMQRISENEPGRLKADAVLALVPFVLGLIPRKFCSSRTVATQV